MYKGRPKLRKILKSMLECALVIVGGLCTCSCGLKYINPDLAEDSEWRKIASSKNTHSRKPKSKKVHKPTESEPTERIIREEKKTTVAPRTRPKEKKKKPIVAVFDIQDQGVGLKRKVVRRLGNYLNMALSASGSFQVVPHGQMKRLLVKQKRKSYKKCYDQSCQIDIGRELAAQKTLSTIMMKLGSRCMVMCALYDLKTATSQKGVSIKGGCSEDEIVDSIVKAVAGLAGINN